MCVCERERERQRARFCSLWNIKAESWLLAELNESCGIMSDIGALVYSLISVHEIRVTDNVVVRCEKSSRPSCMIALTWTKGDGLV